jgi:hypothetical protein
MTAQTTDYGAFLASKSVHIRNVLFVGELGRCGKVVSSLTSLSRRHYFPNVGRALDRKDVEWFAVVRDTDGNLWIMALSDVFQLQGRVD